MAKFTVYFKDKAIQSHIFEPGVIHLGRDETNDLIIDNLSVAPTHAVVIIKENSCIIKQLNESHPLIVNNEKNKEALLQNNDKITIGKHSIVFNTAESITLPKNLNTINREIESLNEKIEVEVRIPDANFQVLDGQHIGRVLPLKKVMTRFGHSGSGVVVVSKRKNGYFISSLESGMEITVNKKLLAERSVFLKHNDVVVIDQTSMLFFLEN